jgi:hypothetical protein
VCHVLCTIVPNAAAELRAGKDMCRRRQVTRSVSKGEPGLSACSLADASGYYRVQLGNTAEPRPEEGVKMSLLMLAEHLYKWTPMNQKFVNQNLTVRINLRRMTLPEETP